MRPRLAGLPPAPPCALAKLAEWCAYLGTSAAQALKETELLPQFLTDLFVGALGYVAPPDAAHTFKRESAVEVDGVFADAMLGVFAGGERGRVVVEGKGPRDPLDRPFGGRKKSAVGQALGYAVQERLDWYVVTNMRETWLLHKGRDPALRSAS